MAASLLAFRMATGMPDRSSKFLRRYSGFERAALLPVTIIRTPFASLAAVAVASAAGADGVLSGRAKVKR